MHSDNHSFDQLSPSTNKQLTPEIVKNKMPSEAKEEPQTKTKTKTKTRKRKRKRKRKM
jgi:hypothetical protein